MQGLQTHSGVPALETIDDRKVGETSQDSIPLTQAIHWYLEDSDHCCHSLNPEKTVESQRVIRGVPRLNEGSGI